MKTQTAYPVRRLSDDHPTTFELGHWAPAWELGPSRQEDPRFEEVVEDDG